jgi:DNA-binding NtrC family response regulator
MGGQLEGARSCKEYRKFKRPFPPPTAPTACSARTPRAAPPGARPALDDWLGNIRELQNVIERAVILCASDTFAVEERWLQREVPPRSGPAVPLVAARAAHERALIEAALAACRGRVSGPAGAAAKLGLPRQTLESKIKALGIPLQRFKTRPGD